MPLVRFGVKNEYKLGAKELYKDGVLNEDPKAVLDGVAVAGFVGVLRQLGDLAQFAAEVFHGLQEQVASTSSRSRKLVNRVQKIEASLPSVEKAILSQTDHLCFAYTHGSEVHACIRIERNHFICDDLPHFVMDSYEECKEPPRLQLLDRFDSGGPGSCLKRYSDPTFFKRASCSSEVSKSEKSQRERKARKIKKRRSWQRSEQFPKSEPILNGSGRMQISSTGQGQYSLPHTGSTFDITFKSDLENQSDSRGSKDDVGLIESVSHPMTSSTQPEITSKGLSSSVPEAELNTNGSIYLGEQTAEAIDDSSFSHAEEAIPPRSSNATWDETLELYEPGVKYVTEDIRQMPVTNSSLPDLKLKLVNENGISQVHDLSESGGSPKSTADEWHLKTRYGNLVEPTRLSCGSNEVQDYHTTNFVLQEHYLEPPHPNSCTQMMDLSQGGNPPEPTTIDNSINYPTSSKFESNEAQYLLEVNTDVAEKGWETTDSEVASPVNAFIEDGSNVKSIEWEQQESEIANAEHVSRVDEICGVNNVNEIEWKEQDLETVNLEHVSQENAFSEGGNTLKVIEWNQPELETFVAGHAIEMGTSSEVGNGMKLIKWNMPERETQFDNNVSQVDTFTEGGDAVQVIEWNEHDDIDSGTENFVDALYTIESESESDFETEMRKEVVTTTSMDELNENTMHGQIAELFGHLDPEHQSLTASYVCKEERHSEGLERSTSPVSSANVLSPENTQSSHALSESATGQKLDVPMCMADEQSVENSQSTTLSNDTQSPDTCSNDPVVRVESALSEIARSGSAAPGGTKIISAPHVSHETSVSSSTTYPVMRVEPAVSEISSSSAALSNNTQSLNSSNDPVIRVEPALSEIANSGSAAPGGTQIISAPHVSQETSVGSSTTHPLGLWTNGTLFGLAPSKPVVCSIPNSGDPAPTSNSSTFSQCNHDAMQRNDDATGILASSMKEHEHGNKSDIYGQYVGSSNNLSQERLGKTHNTSMGHGKRNSSVHPAIRDLINGDALINESKVPVPNHVKNVSSDASSTSEDKSSLLSVFSRSLLKNGLRRSGSLGYDERHESNSPPKSNEFDNRCHDAVSPPVPETNLVGNLDASVNSPPPSPPLEHMKISFQPVDGFDASRLKLKYPEGIDQYENTLDAFPSFQLVPESTKLQRDAVSDSDNDTFCRSYAYMSDESPSHQSNSDSEQWESGDSTESNDHELYNGLHRISSADSASTSPQHEETYHASVHNGSRYVSNLHALSDPSFHLPILDAKNPFAYQEMKPSLNSAVEFSHLQESTHEPPPLPLPPFQFRVSKPFDEVESNQHRHLDSLSQSFVPKLSGSLITHPTKVDSAKLIDTVQEPATIATPKESATVAKPKESAATAYPKESATIANPKESATIAKQESATVPKLKKEAEEQMIGQELASQAEKERNMDGGGDFLQQIRTKSFNLKRTEPARPIYAPIPATSNKITAILQKANAIRQAVGSDDGEDDSSWSDT